ncbi:MAG: hypothetical protein M3P40_04735 [Actinomycetota bacterium]|nr:hypothetical protein [Actinomycetota bacterium]
MSIAIVVTVISEPKRATHRGSLGRPRGVLIDVVAEVLTRAVLAAMRAVAEVLR